MYTDQRGLPRSVFQTVVQRPENQIEVWLNNSTILQHSFLSPIYHIGGTMPLTPGTVLRVHNSFIPNPFSSHLFPESAL